MTDRSRPRFCTTPYSWKILFSILLLAPICLGELPAFAQDTDASTAEETVADSAASEEADVETPATETAAEASAGLDDKINEAFQPIADWWEGFVLTPIPLGTQVPSVDLLADREGPDAKESASDKELAAVVAGLQLDDAVIDQIEQLIADREAAVAAAENGYDKAAEVANYNEQILGLLDDGQKAKFVAPRRVPVVLIILVVGAGFFTIAFGFINVRLIPFAINVVSGKYDSLEKSGAEDVVPDVNEVDGDIVDTIRDEAEDGEVSHFQALATAVSGTVGLGNISGVAVAIATGGPGATFWMIVCGFLGMSTKFVECTLGVKYRDVESDGTVHGGPMYYLKKGLGQLGLGPVGSVMAVVFAVLCIGASFGGGNAFQANQAAAQVSTLFGFEGGATGALIGLVMAVLVGVVIIGGIKRIATVTEKIVPLMAVIYVAAALIIILGHITYLPSAIGQIIAGAFTPQAGFGGMIGVLMVGFQRAAFSNEAGAGSAAIAHSAVKTKYPASEGVVALLEPFIDTVVICTMTALVIVLYNGEGAFQYADVDGGKVLIAGERIGGVDLTSMAFDTVLPGFKYVLTVAIILFAFSTMISWSYYGLQSWKFLFGRTPAADMSYKILFCLFIIIGAAASLDAVIKFSDAMILALVFPNMLGLLLLFPKVRQELMKYLGAVKQSES